MEGGAGLQRAELALHRAAGQHRRLPDHGRARRRKSRRLAASRHCASARRWQRGGDGEWRGAPPGRAHAEGVGAAAARAAHRLLRQPHLLLLLEPSRGRAARDSLQVARGSRGYHYRHPPPLRRPPPRPPPRPLRAPRRPAPPPPPAAAVRHPHRRRRAALAAALAAALVAFATGCAAGQPQWRSRQVPRPDGERAARAGAQLSQRVAHKLRRRNTRAPIDASLAAAGDRPQRRRAGQQRPSLPLARLRAARRNVRGHRCQRGDDRAEGRGRRFVPRLQALRRRRHRPLRRAAALEAGQAAQRQVHRRPVCALAPRHSDRKPARVRTARWAGRPLRVRRLRRGGCRRERSLVRRGHPQGRRARLLRLPLHRLDMDQRGQHSALAAPVCRRGGGLRLRLRRRHIRTRLGGPRAGGGRARLRMVRVGLRVCGSLVCPPPRSRRGPGASGTAGRA
mmetsp:Transcript_40363/g.130663  ORF Transcript_40363/g.130663 Transcript_40363/m.130663 type:complete len:452 (+) Transcript_40363:249-1604(+)